MPAACLTARLRGQARWPSNRRTTPPPMRIALFVPAFMALVAGLRAERINHEGRILGPEVPVMSPILFNTAGADAVLAAMQIMPVESAWNEDISTRPLLANSAAMIAQIRADLSASRRTLRAFHEMNFVLVPDGQSAVSIVFDEYPDESDPSPYPIPGNMPIETWPRETGTLTLLQWQQDINNTGGDRHSIVVMPGTGTIWETWQAKLIGSQWHASNGARFPLRSNAPRPAGWTSGDAAGLPMFPALVRYDECLRGMVEHAMRIVVRRTRREYIYPATHYASTTPASEVNVPAMGQRVRLKADFAIPGNWTVFERAVCLGLKQYGALVADNGNFFSISVTPDDRYPAGAFDRLATIDVNSFEVVQTTGATGGPRSPGAPTADAGADFAAMRLAPVSLNGTAAGSGAAIQWTKYAGPGAVTFANASAAATSVMFSESGSYTLVLSARDGVHAVAYDAVVVTVSDTPPVADPSARLINISTRSLVGVGDAIQIGGFTISGSAPKSVLVRAGGPSLAAHGVAGVLGDPVLTVFSGSTAIAANDDWDASLAGDFARVGAVAWPVGSKDAAVMLTLPPGGYTAHVNGRDNTTGIALVEVFDADAATASARLVNISTRSVAAAGDEVQIGGFFIEGGAKRVVIRAAGPALASAGVTGVLADPVLTLYSGSTVIAQNDDWDAGLAPDFARVGAFAWPAGSKDAALALILPAGAYTAHVSGKDGASGVALVEVYEDR
jgi:hypothetical protein